VIALSFGKAAPLPNCQSSEPGKELLAQVFYVVLRVDKSGAGFQTRAVCLLKLFRANPLGKILGPGFRVGFRLGSHDCQEQNLNHKEYLTLLWQNGEHVAWNMSAIRAAIRQFGWQFASNSRQFGVVFGNSGIWMFQKRYYSGNSVRRQIAFYKSREGGEGDRRKDF